MADRPSAEQIGRIETLANALALDNTARYYRIREAAGKPVVVISQLTADEADRVIRALEADNDQPTLPGTETAP